MKVEVIEKVVNVEGEEIIIEIVKMGEEEGWTTQQASQFIGLTDSSIRRIVIENMLVWKSDDHLNLLKQAGVVPMKASKVNFLPKETIKALVKIVNTPEAWAIYNQLWTSVESSTAIEQRVSNLEKRLTKVEKHQKESSLTGLESSALYMAVQKNSKRVGSGDASKGTMLLLKALKEKYGLSAKGHTYRNIPSQHFEEALDFVNSYKIVSTVKLNFAKFKQKEKEKKEVVLKAVDEVPW